MTSRKRQASQTRGFTLIELLVVVAIMALLISILLPSLGKAREQARSVVCGKDMNELFKGVYMYQHDFDGWLPNFNENYIARGGGFWSQQIMKYIKNAELFLCPTDQLPIWEYIGNNEDGIPEVISHNGNNVVPNLKGRGKPQRLAAGGGGGRGRGGSGGGGSSLGTLVAPNSYISNCNAWLKAGVNRPRRLSEFKYPAFFIFLVEGDRGGGSGFDSRSRCFEWFKDFCGGNDLNADGTASLTGALYLDQNGNPNGTIRHNKRGNYIFVDGHVELMTPNEVVKICKRIEYIDSDGGRRPPPTGGGGGGRGR